MSPFFFFKLLNIRWDECKAIFLSDIFNLQLFTFHEGWAEGLCVCQEQLCPPSVLIVCSCCLVTCTLLDTVSDFMACFDLEGGQSVRFDNRQVSESSYSNIYWTVECAGL